MNRARDEATLAAVTEAVSGDDSGGLAWCIEHAAEQAIARAPAAPEGPKPVVNPAPLPSPDSTAAAPAPAKDERPVTPITGLDADLAVPASPNEPELKQLTRKDEKLAPSAEPAKPDPATVAAGQRFEPDIPPVAHAEILPSTFVKLADGSISAEHGIEKPKSVAVIELR